jgi:KDO2-lipid IV(A) lauroyltransferase
MRWSGAPLTHRVVGHLLLGAVATLRRLPAALAYALADLATPTVVAYALLHERRVAPRGRGLFRNQRIVFREELTRRRSLRLLLGWARHMTHLAVDFCRMPGIDASNLERHVDARAIDLLRRIAAEGRGVICVSGHIGVWELAGHAVNLRGVPLTVVARPSGIRPLNDVINDVRRSGGQRVLEKRGVLWPLKKTLDRGEAIGFLADENAPDSSLFPPFLGTPAATHPTAAFLHRLSAAPIAVMSCHRTGRGRFRIHVWDVIRHTKTDDREADLRVVSAAINDALSRAILAYPEQWFWSSRRFLTRPPGESAGADGLPPRAA